MERRTHSPSLHCTTKSKHVFQYGRLRVVVNVEGNVNDLDQRLIISRKPSQLISELKLSLIGLTGLMNLGKREA